MLLNRSEIKYKVRYRIGREIYQIVEKLISIGTMLFLQRYRAALRKYICKYRKDATGEEKWTITTRCLPKFSPIIVQIRFR